MWLSLCQDWHCVSDSQGPQQKSMTRDFETVTGRHERGTRVGFTFENSGRREGLTEREREREREREERGASICGRPCKRYWLISGPCGPL